MRFINLTGNNGATITILSSNISYMVVRGGNETLIQTNGGPVIVKQTIAEIMLEIQNAETIKV